MKTILWIDDEEDLLKAGVKLFLEYGFEVLTATNMTRALTMLREQRLDGVLLDVKLRDGEDGLELLPELHRLYPTLKIVIFTAFPDDIDRFTAKRLGASFYFAKMTKLVPVEPVKRDKFFAALHQIFDTDHKLLSPEPSTPQDLAALHEHADNLSRELFGLKQGADDAYKYQDLVHRILTFCFQPHLADGRPQERTYQRTLIRDLVFLNEGNRNFWRYTMQTYGSFLIVFELKNKTRVTGGDVDQLATYLGDAIGRLGFLVSRDDSGLVSFNRRKAIFNKDSIRKVILHLTDRDLVELLKLRSSLKDTTDYIQSVYRKFMVSIE